MNETTKQEPRPFDGTVRLICAIVLLCVVVANPFIIRAYKDSWLILTIPAGVISIIGIMTRKPNTGLERTQTRSGSGVRSEPSLGSGSVAEK